MEHIIMQKADIVYVGVKSMLHHEMNIIEYLKIDPITSNVLAALAT